VVIYNPLFYSELAARKIANLRVGFTVLSAA